jgi:four helix bundle protein
MHNFEKLKIWQKAMDIAVEVYEISLLLPDDEKFNLIHQIKKCAVSIPSNNSTNTSKKVKTNIRRNNTAYN